MTDDRAITLWTFIRNDLGTSDFEAWLYSQGPLDDILGHDLAFDLLSTDYRRRDAVYLIKQRLAETLRPLLSCECLTLSDLAAVPMGADGQDGRVFSTLEPIGRHSDRLWWLHAYRCRACGQTWLTAHEERMYDEHLFRRLTEDQAQAVTGHNQWPDCFLTFEEVLKTGAQLSSPWRWDDPFAASLVYTVADLKKERPDITPEEIAASMGIEVDHVRLLLRTAVLP